MAKTYLYLKSSQLGQKSIDDLLLQVHGDMRRFEELRTLLPRMAHRHPDQQTTLYEDTAEETTYYDDNDSWSTVTGSWKHEWKMVIGPLALTPTSSTPGTKVGTAMPRPTIMMMTTTVNKVNGMSLGTRLDIMRNQPMPERRDLYRAFEQHG